MAAGDVKTFHVIVSNVAPTLMVVGPQTINEGSLLSITDLGMFTDPGFDNPLNTHDPSNGGQVAETFTYSINWDDGTSADTGSATIDTPGGVGKLTAGSFDGSHTYADNGDYTVKVTVTDDDGGVSDVKTFHVIVSNVAPTLIASVRKNQAVEGSPLSITNIGTFTDPGFDNPLNTHDPTNGGETTETFTYTIDWDDGRPVDTGSATIDTPGGVGKLTAGSFDGFHTYADNGDYTVTVTVFDDDGGSDSHTFHVIVSNVDPSLTFTDTMPQLKEGQTFTLTQIGVGLTDPGFSNPLNTLDPSNGGEVEESFPAASFTINWGDGNPTEQLIVLTPTNGTPTTLTMQGTQTTANFNNGHTYADNGTYTVTATLQDDDGLPVTQTFKITVLNVIPTVTVVGPQTVNEGTKISLTNLGTFTDPGFDNPLNTKDPSNGGQVVETFTYSIDWGDKTIATPDTGVATIDLHGSPGVMTAGSFDGSHTYADDGDYTVKVTVTDDDNGVSDVQTFHVIVTNVAPTLGTFPVGNDFKELQGTKINTLGQTTINFNLTDPGFDNPNDPNPQDAVHSITDTTHETFTYIVDWGDGTVDAVHTYNQPLAPGAMVTVEVDGTTTPLLSDGNLLSVVTLVSNPSHVNDPNAPKTTHLFTVSWGDGTVSTFQLTITAHDLPGIVDPKNPDPNNPLNLRLANDGQTTIDDAQRLSGAVGIATSANAQVTHTYLGAPDPAHPADDVPIRLTVIDDNDGLAGGVADPHALIAVSNPGITTQMIFIGARLGCRVEFPARGSRAASGAAVNRDRHSAN